MTHIHIDMNPEIQKLLNEREQDWAYRAIVQGDPYALSRLASESAQRAPEMLEKLIRENRASQGAVQVESLLRFMVDRPTERALEDADVDNLVYDQLGEHRVLGKKKSRKEKQWE